MSSTFQDYFFTTTAGQRFIIPLVNQFIRLKATATVISDAATDDYGRCQFTNVPDDTYTVSYGPTGGAPWTATGDTGYKVSSGGGGGGSMKLQDLGEITAVELLAGPKTLYTFGAGERLLTALLDQGAIDPDNNQHMNLRLNLDSGPSLTDGSSVASGILTGNGIIPAASVAVYASINSGDNGSVYGDWQASHAYDAGDGVVGAGRIWYADPGGTSAGVAPNWAAGIGGSVADGPNIVWFDNGLVPTVGSAHAYALIAVPQ